MLYVRNKIVCYRIKNGVALKSYRQYVITKSMVLAIPADPEACVEYVRNMAGNRGITEVTINRCYSKSHMRYNR